MNNENTRAAKIEKILAQNLNLDEVFVTSDDFAFTTQIAADSHAHSLADKKIEHVQRNAEVISLKSEILDQSVPKLTASLEEVTDVEVLNALLDEENATEAPRKTAVAAIEARIAALVPAIKVVEEIEVVAETEAAIETEVVAEAAVKE